MPKSTFWWGILAGILLVTAFNFSLIANINKPVGFAYADDAYHVYFIIKHYINVYTSNNWASLPTLPMFYGTKNSLFFLDHHLLQGLIAIPIYLVTRDVIATSNILMVATLYASFLSMYILVWYFTKSVFPSLLGGIIYVFNPFISDWVPGYMLLFSLEWTPFVILFFEKLLSKPSSKYGFLFFLFIILKLLGTSLYYSIFLMVLLPIYIAIRIWQEKVHPESLINKGLVIGFLLFLLTAAINGYLYLQVFTTHPPNRDLQASEYYYSAWASSWFFTSETNVLYSGLLAKTMSNFPHLFPLKNNEQNLFWGIVPIILFIISFKVLPRSVYRKYWLAFLVLLAASMLMTFGPRIHITDQLSIVGPYSLVYKINPLFRFTRVPARFGAFVFMFLGLILALTLSELIKNLNNKKASILSAVIILLILFEYRNYPIQFITIPHETKEFYAFLQKQRQIHEIIDLPIANRLPLTDPNARVENADADYYLWATIGHDKTIFNGYSSYMPDEYNKRAIILSLNFPSLTQLKLLKKWGVDGIVLHEEEYKMDHHQDQFFKVKKGLNGLGVKNIYSSYPSSGELDLFDLTSWKSTSKP